MEDSIKSATLEGKKSFSLPEGATVVSKEVRITVEEIENGFLLRKSYDIKWTMEDDTNYDYYSKVWYSKENPITYKEPKNLADKLD